MTSPEDRRIIRTKKAIRNALVRLILEKGFETLTVKDITTEANINRGTFYLHYKDKFDLLEQTLEEVIKDFEEILLELVLLSPEDFKKMQIPLAVISKVFEYIDANALLIQALLETKGWFVLQNSLKKVMWRNLFEKNYTTFIKKENLLVPSKYLVSYIASAHFGVIQEWLENGRRESPQEMAQILLNLTFRGPLTAAGIIH